MKLFFNSFNAVWFEIESRLEDRQGRVPHTLQQDLKAATELGLTRHKASHSKTKPRLLPISALVFVIQEARVSKLRLYLFVKLKREGLYYPLQEKAAEPIFRYTVRGNRSSP